MQLSRCLQHTLHLIPVGKTAASVSLKATAANQREYELGMLSLQIPVMESQALEGIWECVEFRPLPQQAPGQKLSGSQCTVCWVYLMLLISSKFCQHSWFTYPCNKLASKTGMACASFSVCDFWICQFFGLPKMDGLWLEYVRTLCTYNLVTPSTLALLQWLIIVFHRNHVQPLMARSFLKEHVVLANVRLCLHFLPQHRTRNWMSGNGVKRVLKSQKEVYKTKLLLLNGVPREQYKWHINCVCNVLFLKKDWKQIAMIDLICQLGWQYATVLRYLVKYCFGCFHEDVLWIVTFKSVGLSKADYFLSFF